MPYPVREKPERDFPNLNGVLGIRCHFSQAGGAFPALTAGQSVHIGTLPPGAFLLPAQLEVITLFNGTTPVVIIGHAADDDSILTAAASAVGTAGYKANLITGALYNTVITASIPLYIKLTGTGVTAGELDFLLPFYAKLD